MKRIILGLLVLLMLTGCSGGGGGKTPISKGGLTAQELFNSLSSYDIFEDDANNFLIFDEKGNVQQGRYETSYYVQATIDTVDYKGDDIYKLTFTDKALDPTYIYYSLKTPSSMKIVETDAEAEYYGHAILTKDEIWSVVKLYGAFMYDDQSGVWFHDNWYATDYIDNESNYFFEVTYQYMQNMNGEVNVQPAFICYDVIDATYMGNCTYYVTLNYKYASFGVPDSVLTGITLQYDMNYAHIATVNGVTYVGQPAFFGYDDVYLGFGGATWVDSGNEYIRFFENGIEFSFGGTTQFISKDNLRQCSTVCQNQLIFEDDYSYINIVYSVTDLSAMHAYIEFGGYSYANQYYATK